MSPVPPLRAAHVDREDHGRADFAQALYNNVGMAAELQFQLPCGRLHSLQCVLQPPALALMAIGRRSTPPVRAI